MNRPMRKVSIAIAVLFLALFVNLNIVQIVQGNSYRNNAGNARVHYNEYSSPRGSIQVQGRNIASSTAGGPLKYERKYADGPLYAPVTGYFPFNGSATQIESSENSILSGDSEQLFTTKLADILTGRGLRGGSVELTINRAAQQAAYAALKGSNGQYKPGAVVALDPKTGAILASVSTPSYDPNVLSSSTNLALAAHALGCYQALSFPTQGLSESSAAFAARTKANLRAQLILRGGGSTLFLADYLKDPKGFALGDTEYSTDPSDAKAQIATWTPYIALDNLDAAKGADAATRRQLASAYTAQFTAHNTTVDSTAGQYANGVSGCSDIPLDPTSVFASDYYAPSPLINKGFYERYFAGSIFKIVDSALALSTDASAGKKYTPSTSVPAPNGFRPYQPNDTSACPAALNTACVENFDGESCDNGKTATLEFAFAKSCNTAFAQLVVQKLKIDALEAQAKKFGFESTNQFSNLPPPYSPSTIGDPAELSTDLGALAQTAFGQHDVQVTPILAAMMSAAIANDGTMMKPYLVKSELRPDGLILDSTTPSQYSQVIDPAYAPELQQMMESVITSPEGTGSSANVTSFGSQVAIGGKTGTADTGATSASKIQPDAWFTGFAMVKSEPKIAVAVLLEHAGVAGDEVTGGKAAGPVAAAVITAYLKSIGVH